MKKGGIISIIIIVVIVIGICLFINQKPKSGIPYNESLPAEEQDDYVGEQTTIFFKDFKAIMKADWQEFEDSSSTYSTITYLPPKTDSNDLNAEYISIAISYLGENNQYTLENLLEQGLESSKTIMPDFELIESSNWENDFFSGKKIKFAGTSEGIKRNFIQVFGIEFNQLYAITYSCPENNCNFYAIYNVLTETFEPIKAEKR